MLQPTVPFLYDMPKLTIYMRTPRVRFREVHYYGSVGRSGANSLYSLVPQIQTARFQILAGNCYIDKTEVSLCQTKRYTLLNTAYANFQPTVPFTPIDNDNDCIRGFARSGAAYRKSIYLGGIPDSGINDDAAQQAAVAGFFANVTSYFNLLQSLGLGFSAVLFNGSFPRVRIGGLFNSAGGGLTTFTCTTLDPHMIVPSTDLYPVVRISGITGTTALLPMNQLWSVTVEDAFNFTLNHVFNGVTAVVGFGGGGWAHQEIKGFAPYTLINYSTVPDTRNRGVRSNPVRGSRKFKRTIGY